jgi:hypothetical protein
VFKVVIHGGTVTPLPPDTGDARPAATEEDRERIRFHDRVIGLVHSDRSVGVMEYREVLWKWTKFEVETIWC